MRELIFIKDRKDLENYLWFRLDDELWDKLFHEIAFLAESGKDSKVRFWNRKEKNNVIKGHQKRKNI